MQIFILVDQKDVCSKHTWATLEEELDKDGLILAKYFDNTQNIQLEWNEYLTYEEYMDAVHNYKIIDE